jgi:hypothetical protein
MLARKTFCETVVLKAVEINIPSDLNIMSPLFATAWSLLGVTFNSARTVLDANMPTPTIGEISMMLYSQPGTLSARKKAAMTTNPNVPTNRKACPSRSVSSGLPRRAMMNPVAQLATVNETDGISSRNPAS